MKKKKTKKITIKKVWLFQLGNQVEEIGEYELGYPLEKNEIHVQPGSNFIYICLLWLSIITLWTQILD